MSGWTQLSANADGAVDGSMLIPLVTVCFCFAGSFGALPLWMTAFGYAAVAKIHPLVMQSEAKHPEKQIGKEMTI